jgi:hypothetical protein
MRVVKKIIEYGTRSENDWYLVALGDLHLGNKNCDLELFKKAVDFVKNEERCLWLGMGDYCLRLDTEILTRDGFKKFYATKDGEEVLSYVDGNLVWGKLKGVYLSLGAEMKRLKSKSFDVVASERHKWIVRKHSRNNDIVKKETKDLKTQNSIVLSAYCKEDGEIKISDREAKLIGWMVTDGCLRLCKKNAWQGNICQTKEQYRTEIRNDFSDWITSEYVRDGGDSVFNIKASVLRDVLGRLNTNPKDLKKDLKKIVTRLSAASRRAMFEVMLKAEGWNDNGWWFSQSVEKGKDVMEAFSILAVMEGNRISLGKVNKQNVMQKKMMGSKRVHIADVVVESLGKMMAWCPITEFGSWVFRQGNQIGITGNCDAVTCKDKRYDPNSIDTDYATPDVQYRAVEDLLRPIKDKCIGLLDGNHDYMHWLEHSHNYVDTMAYDLGTEYLTMDAYVRLVFKRNVGTNNASRNIDVYAHHGWSTARSDGAKVNRIEDLALVFPNLDLYLMGHVHLLGSSPSKFQLSVDNKMNIVQKKENFVFTGSYLKGYVDGNVSYVERKTYAPTALGSPKIKISIAVGRNYEDNKIEVSEV